MKKPLPYSIIVSDIDGTLLDSNRDIAPATAKIINQLYPETKVLLASSRMPSAMYYLQEKLEILGQPLIAYNGGLILGENQKILHSITLPLAIIEAIVKHQQPCNYNLSAYCDDDWYTAEKDQWTLREINNTRVEPTLLPSKNLLQTLDRKNQAPHKCMVMGSPAELDDLILTLKKEFDDSANFYRSKETYLEITPKAIDKSKAITYLLDNHYGFEMNDVIAFGDNHNDETMLKNAGMGVAVANATPNVKDVAHTVSQFTNKENAVALMLESLMK
ncbi:MAG: Cof-type HAD-IIB family hydrolase [Leeuwenhoekiella sp.]